MNPVIHVAIILSVISVTIALYYRSQNRKWKFRHAVLRSALMNYSGQERPRLAAKYHELLLAVEKKYPGESRHQTALRYIREREQYSNVSVASAEAEQ